MITGTWSDCDYLNRERVFSICNQHFSYDQTWQSCLNKNATHPLCKCWHIAEHSVTAGPWYYRYSKLQGVTSETSWILTTSCGQWFTWYGGNVQLLGNKPSGPDCEWFESASGMLLFEHCRVILCSKWLLLKNAAVHTVFDQWEVRYISHWVRSWFSFKRQSKWVISSQPQTYLSHIPDCKILLTGL